MKRIGKEEEMRTTFKRTLNSQVTIAISITLAVITLFGILAVLT